ncbi:MAG: hypothetical protein FWB72_00240 [Firmicutes bacterium]|nr:hypothetical protein [Bacillota bacterium]
MGFKKAKDAAIHFGVEILEFCKELNAKPDKNMDVIDALMFAGTGIGSIFYQINTVQEFKKNLEDIANGFGFTRMIIDKILEEKHITEIQHKSLLEKLQVLTEVVERAKEEVQ